MKFILLIFGMMAVSCFFDAKDDSHDSCGAGDPDATWFFAYDAKDSVISMVITDKNGDTTYKDYFEYDADGFKVREVNITVGLGGSPDTICSGFERVVGEAKIRSFFCEEPARTIHLLHLDSSGRVIRNSFIDFDSTEWSALVLIYDAKGQLVQIDSEKDGIRSVGGKNTYDDNGQWLVAETYKSDGTLLSKDIYGKKGPSCEDIQTLDGSGKQIRRTMNLLNNRKKVLQSKVYEAT